MMNLERVYGSSSPELYPEPGEPIVLVYGDKNGFYLSDLGARMLQSMDEPLAVVSVCGQRRSGKSFILNQLLGRSSGFKIHETRNHPCTMGLWFWSSPVWRIAPDGTAYNILFLDTESFDSFYYRGARSIQFASLAVLLSSMFLYNQMGSLDDVALHLLSCVIEMTKHIQLQASKGSNAAPMLDICSPALLFLLRDFDLGLVESNHLITAQEHLEHTLGRVELGGSGVPAARNKMRESIRAFFTDRECFPLVNPVIDQDDLVKLDQIAPERLRPEFRRNLATLKTLVLERTRPKQVGNRAMTGPMLVEITRMFLDALNRVAVPSPPQRTVEDECLTNYQIAMRRFMDNVDSRHLGGSSMCVLEEKLEHSMYLFYDALGNYRNEPLYEVYLTSLKSALEKKIVALRRLANEKVDLAPGEFFDPSCRGTQDHEELVCSGVRRRKNVHSLKEIIGVVRSDEDGMSSDFRHRTSSYDIATRGVFDVSKS